MANNADKKGYIAACLSFSFPFPVTHMWKWQCMIQWMESLPVFRQKLLKRLAMLSLWMWWFCLGFFDQTLEEKLILQEIWELICHLSEWTQGKECSMTYSVSLFMALFWYFLFNNFSERQRNTKVYKVSTDSKLHHSLKYWIVLIFWDL